MKIIEQTSIKKKLTWVIMLTSLITLTTACIAFSIYEFNKFRTTVVEEMSSMALMIGFNSTAPLEFHDNNEGKEVLEAFRADPRIIVAQIFDAKGKEFATYQTSDLNDLSIPIKPRNDGDYFEEGYLSIYKPIIHREDRIGTIHILMDSLEMEKRFREYAMIVLGVVLCSSFTAYLFSFFLQRTISKPVIHLAETAERVSRDNDYSIRAEKKSNDEVGILIQRFNQMLSQIQERDIALKTAQNNLEDRVKVRTHELNLAKEEAEKSNLAKSDFLSRMSHELRTPMNAILGFGQLLSFDEKEPLTESQKSRVNEILTAGNHLLELINELLDLARVESGKLTLSLEEVNFMEVINEVVSIISPLASQRNIQIISPDPHNASISILADRTRLKQALLNLMANAVKFNQENGSITLEIEDARDDRVIIHIVDTGRGVPEDKLETLFESFNRLDADDTGVEGTGIGLNITKKLVELMDGTITVDSVLGEGSRFSIELAKGGNLESSEEELVFRPVKKMPQVSKDHKYTLLYVEDNPANLEVVEQILSNREEINLLTAFEAQLGIELANFQQPDLILMDINLPGMDGITAMKHLKENKKTCNIPVIAMSANAMQSQIDNALVAGFDSYITKPIELEFFLKTIFHHLNFTNNETRA
jgi:signal transduction histidine kinase/ActR/RegA family two-component response regulator